MTVHHPARRYYRLRTPDAVAVCVRVADDADLYLAVGRGARRLYLTPDEAWAAWRCLSEAVASLGPPPGWIRVQLTPSTR